MRSASLGFALRAGTAHSGPVHIRPGIEGRKAARSGPTNGDWNMRSLVFAVLALGVLGILTETASARREWGDGCNDDRGYLVCRPGAYPGVPYRGRRYRANEWGDGCNTDRGYLVCKPGARPGVPYYEERRRRR